MKSFRFAFASILLSMPMIAFPYVIGNSNLSLGRYPEFDGYAPRPPYSKDQYSYDQYRQEVQEYVRSAKEYAEACENDAKRAYEAAEDAINKANEAVREFNNWVTY